MFGREAVYKSNPCALIVRRKWGASEQEKNNTVVAKLLPQNKYL